MDLARLTPAEQLTAGRLPRRLLQLFVGLTAYGVAMALLVRSGLGMLPWDVFHYGVALHVPLSLGTVVILVSLVVLLLWIPLRQMPGLGTVANAFWIGIALDVALPLLPEPQGLLWQIGYMLLGIVGNAFATALYIGAQLGPGPRDGLMTGLASLSGASLRLVRTGIEMVVVVLGWFLGGMFGIGTILYAVAVGPLVQWMLPWSIIELPTRSVTGTVREP